MQHWDNKREVKNKSKREKEEISLAIKITSILLFFCGLVSLISLLQVLPRLNVQTSLDIVGIFSFIAAYGIWKRKKWAFYASLILFESLIIIYPLIAAFSPYFHIGYNWICLVSFVVVGISVVPVLISKENYFEFEVKVSKLQKFIEKLPIFNLLFVIFGVALVIRTVLPYSSVFKDTVRFASDDAVFHMRLVENALFGDHFPKRLFFDAYTYFPHGDFLHFTPLFDLIIIFAAKIIGLGSPTKELMEVVGAYYPAILGALVIFPTYIIGKEIWNKYAGLIAALLLAILPGQFLSRSIIGFTDHHIGEVLFSTVTIMFLVLAIKRAKEDLSERDISSWVLSLKSPVEWIRNRNFPFLCYTAAILLLFYVIPWEWWVFFSFIFFLLALIIFNFWKKPDSYVFFTILAGMALGFYLFIWIAGLLFVLIIFAYGVIQYVLNGLRGEERSYICFVLIPVFLIPLIMLIPFFGPPFPYDIRHIGSLSAGIITFAIPLFYRHLAEKFVYKKDFAEENEKERAKKEKKVAGQGEYICPICGKKSKGVIEHIRTKHRGDIEERKNFIKLKYFFEKNPELRTGIKKLGIKLKPDFSEKVDFLLPLFIIVLLFILSFTFFPSISGAFSTLTPSGSALTVAEIHPMDIGTAWRWFTTPFFISFLSMAILAMYIIKRNKPECLLLLIWSVIMLVAVGGLGCFGIGGIGQNRFAYYYAVNAALLSALFFVFHFNFLTRLGLEKRGKEEKKEKKAVSRSRRKGGKEKISKETPLDIPLLFFAPSIMILFLIGIIKIGIESIIPLMVIIMIFLFWRHASKTNREDIKKPLTKILAVLLIAFLIFYPFPLNVVAKPFPSSSNLPLSASYAINTAKRGIGANENWYEALRWMRENTPNPGIDYYGIYKPPLNETKGKKESYKYPSSAYGVMSWWDYGHMITWIGHRIPNANPFQAGIGGPGKIKYVDSDMNNKYTKGEKIIQDNDRNNEFSEGDVVLYGERPALKTKLAKFDITEMYFDSNKNGRYTEGEPIIRDNDGNSKYSEGDDVLFNEKKTPAKGKKLKILSLRPGACMFFLSIDETEANKILDELGTRYVISDFMMADAWNALYNKYSAMTVWAGKRHYYRPSYYYNTIEARLHMFDGSREDVEGEIIPALAHYRLVHESPTFILPFHLLINQTRSRYWRSMSGDYNRMKSQAQTLHGYLFSMPVKAQIEKILDNGSIPEIVKSAFNSTGIPLSENSIVVKEGGKRWTIRDEENKNVFLIKKKEGKLNFYIYGIRTEKPNIKAYTPEYIEPVSFVKVFEYVKGARIEGTAPNGSIIEISTNVTTDRGREFVYSSRVNSNGSYELIVPYSTEGQISGGTNFDVFASPYKIRVGHLKNETIMWDIEKEINVSEKEVMEGRAVEVNF